MNLKTRGFTIIEILVVITILTVVTSILIKNFSSPRFDLGRNANVIVADIRNAQSYALSSLKYNNTFRCGYGIHWNSIRTYYLYAGRDTAVGNCNPDFNYQNQIQTPIIKEVDLGPSAQIPSFDDIFYLPPDPRLYLEDDDEPATNPELITLRNNVNNCTDPSKCIYICVYPSGRVEVYKDSALCI